MLALPEKINTKRLVLRRLRYEDAEEIFYTYASKEEATRYVSWRRHQRVEDTRRFLAFAVNAWNSGRDFSYSVRLRDSNRLVGSIGVINLDGKVQFGYIFSPSQWNLGYATEACSAVLDLLTDIPDLVSITTFVDVDNQASIRVLEKCGLQAEGVFPQWFRFPNQNNEARDCILFSVPRSEKPS